MHRMRLGFAVLAASLLAVAIVAPAFGGSSNNPQWDVNGSVLRSPETLEVLGEGTGKQKLLSSEMTIQCTGDKLEGATIVGGAGALPGSGTETFIFTGCNVKKNNNGEEPAGCKVNSVGETAGTIKTAKLASKLVYANAPAANNEEASNTLSLMKAEGGEKFAQVELSGEGCPFPGKGKYNVEGELLARNKEGSSAAVQHVLEAPSTPIQKYWVNNSGVAKEETISVLRVVGMIGAIYSGNTTVETASKQEWWVTP